MMSSNQRKPETISPQSFQQSLQLLDTITSRQTRGGAILVLLLPVTIILFSFSAPFARRGLLLEQFASVLVLGLLGIIWAVSGFTLRHQRRRLHMLRKNLIEQMDSATKNHERAERFYGLSILDPLTRLYNRRYGETRLEEEIVRAEKSRDPLLLLALDFDRFKHINDTYGHAAGDLALKEFSRRLQRAIRACDVPIRVGGDEFLVILPECPPDKIQLILSRMDSISFSVDGQQISLSFSHGMAQYEVNDTPATMVKRADERLYDQKAKRKSSVGVEQPSAAVSMTHTPAPEPSAEELPAPQQEAKMRPERVRRSGRLPKDFTVVLIGNNLDGRFFSEQTNTIDLSRHGALVVSQNKLAPEQEMIVRCPETNREAEVRVVRVIGSQSDSHSYGLEFVGSTPNIWDVEIPPLTESAMQEDRLLCECRRCKGREIVADSDVESHGDAINKAIIRFCKRCGSATTWTRVLGNQVRTSVAEMRTEPRGAGGRKAKVAKSPMAVTVAERSEPTGTTAELVPLAEGMERQSRACVATAKFGEDIVTCIHMSQGGVSFRSLNAYAKGMHVQIAMPYSSDAYDPPANFVQGRIVDVEEIKSEGMWWCGVEFCLGAEGRCPEAGDQRNRVAPLKGVLQIDNTSTV